MTFKHKIAYSVIEKGGSFLNNRDIYPQFYGSAWWWIANPLNLMLDWFFAKKEKSKKKSWIWPFLRSPIIRGPFHGRRNNAAFILFLFTVLARHKTWQCIRHGMVQMNVCWTKIPFLLNAYSVRNNPNSRIGTLFRLFAKEETDPSLFSRPLLMILVFVHHSSWII